MYRLILCLGLLLIQVAAFSQFSVAYDKQTGAIIKIQHVSDNHRMNWVYSSADSIPTWQKSTQNWGMGKFVIQGKSYNWHIPSTIQLDKVNSLITYQTPHLQIQVTRIVQGSTFLETYTLKNTTNQIIKLDSLGIFVPFNDNYPDAKTCATNRCNTHIWSGLNSSYVNAIRMGGQAPHLGLVFTQGAMESYSVTNRGLDGGDSYKQSNTRGTFLLNMPSINLAPNQTYTVQWSLFWHIGWNDFYAKAKDLGFVKVDVPHYVVNQNSPLVAHIEAKKLFKSGNKTVFLDTKSLGEQTMKIPYGDNKMTILNYYVISSPAQLIEQRINFIVKHQQMNNTNDSRDGAYMVYDNDNHQILSNTKGFTAPSDKDEGRERLGMGVFIAKWLQTHRDSTVYQSLLRYVSYVRNKLQTSDYTVYSNTSHTSRRRGYNYPWVAELYLQTYRLTQDKRYLNDFYQTLNKYYKEFGYHYYAIGIPVKDGIIELRKAGFTTKADSLLQNFKLMGDNIVKNSIYYPKFEVNYEQSIVAPSVCFLLELYRLTNEKKYLNEAKLQLPSLEAFQGKQPDVHLNEIGIRHWDGYWFGKKATWGDTMPHYWSMLTAMAYQQFYEITKDSTYRERAVKTAENNLLNFKENGVASCTYIYPATVNGLPAKFYDSFANDQDWALKYYLDVMVVK